VIRIGELRGQASSGDSCRVAEDPCELGISLQRSRNMAATRGRDTAPERRVSSLLHQLGYRFRLHQRGLPGSPDIVLPRHHTVVFVFVHGCFWHRHPGCRYTTSPGTRSAFREEKFRLNVERYARQQAELRAAGWSVVVVWECELRHIEALNVRLRSIGRSDNLPNDGAVNQTALPPA
jgi:DNA mismatch endonuclease (patch repair protein)